MSSYTSETSIADNTELSRANKHKKGWVDQFLSAKESKLACFVLIMTWLIAYPVRFS